MANLTEDQLIDVFIAVPRCGWHDSLEDFTRKLDLPREVAIELWPKWSQCWQAIAAIGPANLAKIVLATDKPEPAEPTIPY
jgi:hypothetical protein